MVKNQPYGHNMTIIYDHKPNHHHKLWPYYRQNFSQGNNNIKRK